MVNFLDVTDILTIHYNPVMCSAAAEVRSPESTVFYIGSLIYQDWPMFICQFHAETIGMGMHASGVGATGL